MLGQSVSKMRAELMAMLSKGGSSPDMATAAGGGMGAIIPPVPDYVLAKITGRQNDADLTTDLPCYSYTLITERDVFFGPNFAKTGQQITLLKKDAYQGDFAAIDPNLLDSVSEPRPYMDPAFEISGNINVPTDGTAIVQLWRSNAGRHYWFSYPAPCKCKQFFLALITDRIFIPSVSPANLPSWNFSFAQVHRDSTTGQIELTGGTDGVVGGCYAQNGYAPPTVNVIQVGNLNSNTYRVDWSPGLASSGTGTIGVVISGTTYSGTFTSSATATDVGSALVGAVPSSVGTIIATTPVSTGLVGSILITVSSGTFTGIPLFASIGSIEPTGGTNLAIEESDFPLLPGNIVEMTKLLDGPVPTVTIDETLMGDGKSVHSTWTATLANAVGGNWQIEFDSDISPTYTVSYTASSSFLQSSMNTFFSPATFTVSGAAGGPYTVICTSDFNNHALRENAKGLLDNGVYVFCGPYLGPRRGAGAALLGLLDGQPSGDNVVELDCRGPYASGGTIINPGSDPLSARLFFVGCGSDTEGGLGGFSSTNGETKTVPIDNSYPGNNLDFPLFCQMDPNGKPYMDFPVYPSTISGTPFGSASCWGVGAGGTAPSNIWAAIQRLAVYCVALDARVSALDGNPTTFP